MTKDAKPPSQTNPFFIPSLQLNQNVKFWFVYCPETLSLGAYKLIIKSKLAYTSETLRLGALSRNIKLQFVYSPKTMRRGVVVLPNLHLMVVMAAGAVGMPV